MSYEGQREQPEFGSKMQHHIRGKLNNSELMRIVTFQAVATVAVEARAVDAMPPRGGHVPYDDDDDDFTGAAEHATRNAGGNSDLFSSVIGSFLGKKNQLANEDVDEEAAVDHHKKLYGGEDDGSTEHDSSSMGNAAALQALKMFSGGGGGSSGGSSKSEFIGLAMSEASKLFEQQSAAGKVSSGASKESAVQQAGEMALKMYLKSNAGGGGGGSSGLLSMASKFM